MVINNYHLFYFLLLITQNFMNELILDLEKTITQEKSTLKKNLKII